MKKIEKTATIETERPRTKVKLSPLKRVIFTIILLLGFFSFVELAFFFLISYYCPHFRAIKRGLMGKPFYIKHIYNMIGQPYLLYLPAPGYKDEYGLQHNSFGWRGPLVPVKRRPGYLRVLFMGGSTTYGHGEKDPFKTYPAYAKNILEKKLKNQVKGVEVINAGLPAGTSAEILSHYLFKYRYFRPDVLVINSGGNDGSAVSADRHVQYQPDYGHCRQSLSVIKPLPPNARWLLRSNIFTFFAIYIFYSDLDSGGTFVRQAPPLIRWYPPVKIGKNHVMEVPEKDLAFRQNISTVIREAIHSGTKVVLVPFRVNPFNHANMYNSELEAYAHNEQIFFELAKEFNIPIAPFPDKIISREN